MAALDGGNQWVPTCRMGCHRDSYKISPPPLNRGGNSEEVGLERGIKYDIVMVRVH